MTPSKRLFLAASAGVLTLIAVIMAAYVISKPPAGESKQSEALVLVDELPLGVWPQGDSPRKVTIRVDPERGPLLEDAESPPLQLTPTHPALQFSNWQVIRAQSRTQVVGDGKWNDTPVLARWTFAAGNPQAYFSLKIPEFPASLLRENLALKIAFPQGQVSLISPAAGMSAQAALWSGALGVPRISVSNWSGDSLQVAGQIVDSHEARELLLSLWLAPGHLESERCADGLRIDLEMSFMLRFGGAQAPSLWPYADGAAGALVPIFGLPAEHSDPQIAEAAAPDASRWLRRANTLIYGHSNPEDPRFGTGGLLGNKLGATVIVPTRFSDDPKIEALARALDQTPVELAPFGEASSQADAYAGSSRALKSANCAQLAALAGRRTPAVILTQSAPDDAAKRPIHQGPAGWPMVVLPEGFDGRIQSLRLQGFEPGVLSALLETYQTRVFLSPFVATRNPLIGAAHESLLEPERDGHWTVRAPLGGALANLELWREESPIMVASVADLARHRRAVQEVKTWWNAAQQLQVYNPSDTTIHGFTLALPGVQDATLLDSPANTSSRVLRAPTGAAPAATRTLIWWDLKPGLQQISLSEGAGLPDPQTAATSPILWEIKEP